MMKNTTRNLAQSLDVPIGLKRKRVSSINENTHAGGRLPRGAPKLKKLKSMPSRDTSSEEDELTDMEVDIPGRWTVCDASEIDCDEEASDEFLINEASLAHLKRRRKDELLRLYSAAGLCDNVHNLTKLELAEAIIATRDDIASLPPSSPPGRDANSSDYSSDDGNAAGDEETDVGNRYRVLSGFRRRATVHLDHTNHANSRFLKTRSLSLYQINTSHSCPDVNVAPKANATLPPIRRTTRYTCRSSPTPSSSNQLPSPPATRLRSRKISAEVTLPHVDLTVATKKTLLRMRRENLVRMCETRDLDVAGTKPQLARSLLQWRDQRTNDFSSPSSSGTVRPPSTVRHRVGRRKTKSRSQSNTPPVLIRDQKIHQDEPRTPPLSGDNMTQAEPELELDLESLGLEDREIPPDKLTKFEKIGSGGFKDVYIGKFKGRRVAIAEFRDQLNSMDIKELKLLGGFDHPNIVRFLGVSIPENTRETPVMIVSELCSNGDLFDYVRNVPAPSLKKILNIMLDIARGLEYLHLRKPSVIHRDCKSSNILITSHGTAKIADFGLAKVKQSTRSMVRSLVGTVNWQAPELWHAHPKYNHKVDVFSCAMVYWEMLQWHTLNKKFPWEGMNEHAIYDIVGAKRQRPSITGLRKQWCAEIVDLLEQMWAQDPNDRPTMSEVVKGLELIAA